jgi:hypothetical protein
MVKRLALALAVAATAGLAFNVAIASGKTFVVDRDLAQCPKADFVSIQAAVNAAAPGDTIKVCPDLYMEQVDVPKMLTLEGTTGVSKPTDCFEPVPADPTRDAIVQGLGHTFRLLADDIVVRQFVIQGALGGVVTSPLFSGYRIHQNVFQLNLDGLALESNGARQSRADHNCFRLNEGNPSHAVLAPGGGGTLTNTLIDHNDFFDNPEAVRLDGTGPGVTIAHNTSLADGVFINMDLTTEVTIHHNRATGNFFAILAAANAGSEISDNDFGEGFIGMQLGFGAANVGLDIEHNFVHGMTSMGISAIDVDGSLFSNNVLTGNGSHGLGLGAGSTGNQVEYNRADGNGEDGIRNSGTDNTFLRNHMHDNVEHDAHDDDRPANTWIGNKCETDSPPGTICE